MTPHYFFTLLKTDADGYARFYEKRIPLAEGQAPTWFSDVRNDAGYQLRYSAVGFQSEFHCTHTPQWVFILQGQMGIRLQTGDEKEFAAGSSFYSADLLPQGVNFNAHHHGHASRQLGTQPLVTLFVKDSELLQKI